VERNKALFESGGFRCENGTRVWTRSALGCGARESQVVSDGQRGMPGRLNVRPDKHPTARYSISSQVPCRVLSTSVECTCTRMTLSLFHASLHSQPLILHSLTSFIHTLTHVFQPRMKCGVTNWGDVVSRLKGESVDDTRIE
jgi:hypothetical protein